MSAAPRARKIDYMAWVLYILIECPNVMQESGQEVYNILLQRLFIMSDACQERSEGVYGPSYGETAQYYHGVTRLLVEITAGV